MSERIVKQDLLPDGIRQTFESGRQRVIPYHIDESGAQYAELFPNASALRHPPTPDSGA